MLTKLSKRLGLTCGVLSLAAVAVLMTTSCQKQEASSGVASGTVGHYAVGDVASTFSLPGIDGKPVDMSGVFGKSPAVLVFYRGNW